MGWFLVVGILVLLSTILGYFLEIQSAKKTDLERKVRDLLTQIQSFGPIRSVDQEVAQRRKALDDEIASARGTIDEAQRKLDEEIATARHMIEEGRRRAETDISQMNKRIITSLEQLEEAKSRLREYELKLDLEEMGFYQPKYKFEDSLQYAEALDLIREAQKELVRQKLVLKGDDPKIPKPLRNLGKLAVDAFNGEASTIADGVTYSNFEASVEKLRIEFDKINRLLEATGLQITSQYLELKVKELAVAYDYREAAEMARQEQAEIKERIREEAADREDAERKREKAIEEEQRRQQALETARAELATKSAEDREVYEKKVRDLEVQLEAAKSERERATSMAQITRKGRVYIISNLGSFGDGVFKIGMTRRTDPDERIRELGDASVPFGFDVHAMLETDDAPALESTLHRHFEAGRMNKVNLRKEFFRVSIDEIGRACQEMGLHVRLTKLAEAREYRQTQALEARVSNEVVGTGGSST